MLKFQKISVAVFFSLIVMPVLPAFSAELVTLFEEEYEEKYAPANEGYPIIYHHWQVSTQYGPRMLILVGGNNDYDLFHRNLLRNVWRKEHSMFMVDTNELADNHIVSVDIKQIHPVHKGAWVNEIKKQTRKK